MILGRVGTIPFVRTKFSFGREVQGIWSTAVLDTGASESTVPLGILIDDGVSKSVIDEEIERLKLLFANDICYSQSSSGIRVPSIRTYITDVNVMSDGGVFKADYLNIALSLTSEFKLTLLGYDFIMAHNIVRNDNRRLALKDFDKSYYNNVHRLGKSVDINDIMSFISI